MKYPASSFVEVQGVLVDLAALRGIAHRCDPGRCTATPGCCARYEVCLTRDEVPTLLGLLPAAARLAPWLGPDDALENPLAETDDGQVALDTDEDGRCLLAVADPPGADRCALHAAALAEGLDPLRHKPRACALWPLAETEDGPPALGVFDGAFAFACNTRRPPAARGLDVGIAAIVAGLFGADFLAAVLREL